MSVNIFNKSTGSIAQIAGNATGSGGTTITVDNILSATSKNPVQNKVITEELNKKADQTTVDSALSLKANSADVTASLAGKSDTGHTHTVANISDFPTSLPANGGNADTVDGKHAASFLQNLGFWSTGSIKDLILSSSTSGTVFIDNTVSDMPVDNAYWFGFIDRKSTNIIARVVSINNKARYSITYNGGLQTWYGWVNEADGGNAATVNGYTVNANVPAGFSSIGQNTKDKEYTYSGTIYTGSDTSEIFNDYENNMAAGGYSHAEGHSSVALGFASHAEGDSTSASSSYSHAEGTSTTASGTAAHAEGYHTTASGTAAHAEGYYTTATKDYSHAEGNYTTASATNSHAEGFHTTASGAAAHAEGYHTTASGTAAHAEGYYTTATKDYSHAEGRYNKDMSVGDIFVIGNGSDSSKSNCFRVTDSGYVYGLSSFNSSGADYAEFIKPWHDNNIDNEDRVGYFVTIKNGLLYKANEGDYIVGITSGNPSVVGNADEDYYWRYERDEFNRFIYEDVEEEIPKIDDNGNIVMVKTGKIIKNGRLKLADNYDASNQNNYVERKNRPEWAYVGMIGVLPVRDDGTCEAGGFCKCGLDGIATKAEARGFDTFFVIERINESVISVEMR